MVLEPLLFLSTGKNYKTRVSCTPPGLTCASSVANFSHEFADEEIFKQALKNRHETIQAPTVAHALSPLRDGSPFGSVIGIAQLDLFLTH